MHQYIGESYPFYFQTDHWGDIKNRYIYGNPKAKCWICEKTNTLLLHHIQYTNLFHEKLIRFIFNFCLGDLAIVCFDCHERVHFIILFGIFKRKIPLIRRRLVKRMLWLRTIYLFKNRRIAKAMGYLLLYSTVI